MAFTFFFRDLQALTLATAHVAPELAGRRRPKIWDAGCATGPEPYTLAILLAGQLGPFAFGNLRIVASDLDETGQFEAIVKDAEYRRSDLERMPSGVIEEYFEETERPEYFRLTEQIRAAVQFMRHDLLSFVEVEDGFSLIVCKNVLLHFSHDQRVDVIRMFHRALAPGGSLVTEHTQKMPGEVTCLFQQVAAHGQLFTKLEL